MSTKNKSDNQVNMDGFFVKVPTFVGVADSRTIHGQLLEHGGFCYTKVPSIGKYVTQMQIRVATDTPAEMNKHIDAFLKWANQTPLI